MFSSSLSYAAWRPRGQTTSPSKPTAVRPGPLGRTRRPVTELRFVGRCGGVAGQGPPVLRTLGARGEAHSSRRSPGRGRLRPSLRSREGPREKHIGARAGLERFPFAPPKTVVPRSFPAVRGRPGPVTSKTAELGQQVWGKQARGPTSWKAPQSLSCKGRGSSCLRGRLVFLTRVSAGTDMSARARPRDRHVCAHLESSSQPTQARPLARVLRAEVPEQVVLKPG